MAKHRSGAVGDVKLRFVHQFARFENWNKGLEMLEEAFADASQGNTTTHRRESRMNNDNDDIPMDNFSFPPMPGNAGPGPDLSPAPGETEVPF